MSVPPPPSDVARSPGDPAPVAQRHASARGPQFSWSESRARLLRRCRRAYYLSYYAAHEGWRAPAGTTSWLAYRLKKLTTLPALVGVAVHRAASTCARTLAAGGPLPSYRALRATAAAELNGGWRQARDGITAFLRRPAAVCMLDEFLYGHGPDAQALDRARAVLDGSLRALTTVDALWDGVRRAAPEDVIVLDPFWHFELPPDGTTVFAAPDLLVRPARDARWEVTDFKSGRPDHVIDQLLTYAVAAREGLGLDADDGMVGRVVALSGSPGERETTVLLTTDDLEAASARIRDGVGAMHALLRDVRRNLPLAADAFAPATNPATCRTCAFRGLCHPDDFPSRLTGAVGSAAP
ncbi:PD-(D/E)XK nuclease family protein [Roseisolibacter agri]|uniref:PD-(D/E)XK endonuclease-like domain-containing protein n=1 Tax=Roseisolibacter agri TaxID=2014610 RepID=A0AA37Q8L0_9BACT|nr:PD-(D/E)XK nuclease family protein [Roseisolibacter agri]GLC28269.1 hypothetical protein rosag_47820 [Roseisolibacter agri]